MNFVKQKKQIIKNILYKNFGCIWLLVLLQSALASKRLFNKTVWGNKKSPESDYLKSYAIVSALYLILKSKVGQERALMIVEEIVIKVGCLQQNALLQTIGISGSEPMQRLMAFHDLMDKEGATQFNIRKYVTRNTQKCHFIIKKCVYKDFFDATGTPELTHFFCDVDREFFPPAFPKFKVHRGISWENTLAYGKPECDFIFEIL